MHDLVLRAGSVYTPRGPRPGAVVIDGGEISAVLDDVDAPVEARAEVRLADDEVLIPGVVDTHMPRTEWEGFATATAAAAAGGVTTIIDMPLNSIPPTITPEALEVKRKAADAACSVDVGFWGGAVPQNLGSLAALHEAGVFGFKSFLSPSGVPEFEHLSTAQLGQAAAEIAAFGGLLIVHAEDPGVLADFFEAGLESADPELFASIRSESFCARHRDAHSPTPRCTTPSGPSAVPRW